MLQVVLGNGRGRRLVKLPMSHFLGLVSLRLMLIWGIPVMRRAVGLPSLG